ncbi:hypothetical protein N7520_008582 [Penicillium odoratum]|uniref:uncharacterized protein n=1 Tax=Penicillium odoratum TaxID=1167516 RepID=UPI0025478480|nr:uncharacterized protein N7520_008582 [Penicillium odoratum]KAJ5751665.1 hypothetical protein N7520_008582 [Penicillium odoratum]
MRPYELHNHSLNHRHGYVRFAKTWFIQLPVACTKRVISFTPQGSLQYVGRKDLQVKLRGQSIELGEVEHHVRNLISDAADAVVGVISLVEGQMEPQLVTWIKLEGNEHTSSSALVNRQPSWRDAVRTARERLCKVLPNFVIPYVFFTFIASRRRCPIKSTNVVSSY